MGLFRCEDMIRCQMYLPTDAAYRAVAKLGEISAVQFIDLNVGGNEYSRQNAEEIHRIDEMQRKLRYFEHELKNAEREVPVLVDHWLTPAPKELDELDMKIDRLDTDLRDLCGKADILEKHLTEASEIRDVLEKCRPFFPQTDGPGTSKAEWEEETQPDKGIELLEWPERRKKKKPEKHEHLWCSTGVIPVSKMPGFTRIVWLSSRGRTALHFLDTPKAKKRKKNLPEPKVVFLAISQGKELKNQLEIIAKGYKATLYPCPAMADEREELLRKVKQRVADLDIVVAKSRQQINKKLDEILLHLVEWDMKLIKLKATYHVLDMFQQQGHGFLAEAYVPVYRLPDVQREIEDAIKAADVRAVPLITPIRTNFLPTLNKTNKFTKAFQAIIDAYGVANYKEANPALFSIISFPFLFSVMFGDAGHGLIMFFFALLLCIFEKKLQNHTAKNEIFRIIFSGRYVILLMGIFSIYSGVMYNELFSKPFNLFDSRFIVTYDKKTLKDNLNLQMDASNPKVYKGHPYPLGTDPAWELSSNKITFLNSFKKKISVIFGFCQMALGVILKLLNCLFFRDYVGVFCEFIPMFLYLFCVFGYMCGLIFAKWLLIPPTSDPHQVATFYQCSPNILIGFINMFLVKYDNSANTHCSTHTWFNHQKAVQTAMVLLAVISIIWLLLAKPIALLLINKTNKIKVGDKADASGSETVIQVEPGHVDEKGETKGVTKDDAKDKKKQDKKTKKQQPYMKQFTMPIVEEEPLDFGEELIRQAIHMIEFCLGCVSHTASYLRLWALSLAHSQLSDVLWVMVLKYGFSMGMSSGVQAVISYVLICPFAVLTIVILLIMEGLSAFLHTLRLHWVEFNSKFYTGDGVAFKPLSFRDIVKELTET